MNARLTVSFDRNVWGLGTDVFLVVKRCDLLALLSGRMRITSFFMAKP